MNFDLCQNPACEFRTICPLRPVPKVAGEPQRRGTAPVRQTAAVESLLDLQDSPCGPIGTLAIDGELTARHVQGARIAEDVAGQLYGLMVYLNTPGGGVAEGDGIAGSLQAVGRRVPVVCYVERALSSGLIIAAACGHVVADGGGILGGFGVINHFCDGKQPLAIISAQSPQKWSDGPIGPPCRYRPYDAGALVEMQRTLDVKFEQDLASIARWRGVDPEVLRPILDGRQFFGRTALQHGIADVVGDEREAHRQLEQLITEGRNHAR